MYIKTQRLELKPITQESTEALVQLVTDQMVGKTYMLPDLKDRQETEALANRLIALSDSEDRYMAGVYLDKNLIGILHETETDGDWIEIGYAVLPAYQNRGYCTEALCGAIDYFFARGFREVLAGAFEENYASIRVMVKCGMKKLDRQEEIPYRGKVHKCVFYSLRRKVL